MAFLPVLIGLFAAGSWSNPLIADAAPNTWVEVPGSKLTDVCACSHGYPGVCGVEGCVALVSWSGAAYNTQRREMIVWGGGHNAYYGNEVYAFSLDSLKWRRLTDPSAPASPSSCPEVLGDGRPNARHTYDGLAYIAHADKMFATGGALACLDAWSTPALWTFDFAANEWTREQPAYTNCEYNRWGNWQYYEDGSDYDPVTRKVFIEAAYGTYAFDLPNNRMTQVYWNEGYYGDRTGVVDPVRRLFIISRGGASFYAYHIDANPVTREVLATTGGDAILGGSAPGLAYDPVHGDIVGWRHGEVMRLNLDTKVWTGTGASWTSPVIYGGGQKNVYGRWAYDPYYDAFVALGHPDVNVRIYKNSAGGGTRISSGNGPISVAQRLAARPNPFSPGTIIDLRSLNQAGVIDVSVYDVRGARVADLTPLCKEGFVSWRPSALLNAGVYMAVVRAPGRTGAAKLVYMK